MKRVLSLVLALVLVLGMIPTFAAEKTGGEELKALGLLSGNENGDLMEDQTLERQEFAKIIAQLNGALDEAAAYVTPGTFADFDKVEGWAKPYVAYAEEQGWMTGKTGNIFDPAAELKSQELLVVLLRVLGYDDTWSKAFETAAEVGLVAEEITAITRGDAFELIWTAVSEVKMAGKDMTLGVHLGVLEPAVVAPTALEVVSVTATNLKEIVVKFNQAVDKATVLAANFSLSPAAGALTPVLGEDGMTVTITTATAMTNQGAYKLTAEKVATAAELKLAKVVKDFTAFDATLPTVESIEVTGPKTFDIIFSEPITTTGTVTVKSANTTLAVQTAADDDSNVVSVTLYTSLVDGTVYDVTVKDYADAAGYKNVIKTIAYTYAKDATAPTLSVVSANQQYVVLKFNKPVTGIAKANFYHTFSAWTPMEIYKTKADMDAGTNAITTSTTDVTTVYVQFATTGAAGQFPLQPGTVNVNVLGKVGSVEVKDNWGNAFPTTVVPVTIVADLEAPTVTKVEATSNKNIAVTFSKAVNPGTTANYEVLKSDGTAISGLTFTVSAASTTKVNLVLSKSLLGETVIVNVKNIEDTTLNKNKLAATSTTTITFADKEFAGISRVEFDATNSLLYVVFAEAMGSSAVDVANYKLLDVNATPANTVRSLSGPATFFSGNSVVKIELSATEKAYIQSGTDKLLVANAVKDAAGNGTSAFQTEMAIANVGSVPPAVHEVTAVKQIKAIDKNTVTVQFDQELVAVDPTDFALSLDTGATWNAPTAQALALNSTGTLVTLTFAQTIPANAPAAVLVKGTFAGPETVNVFGTAPTTFVGTTVIDKIAPTLTAKELVDTTHITLTYSEALNASSVSLYTYTVAGNTVTAIDTSVATKVTLTLGTAVAVDATPSVTQALDIQDAVGNKLLASATAFTAADKIAPTVITQFAAAGNMANAATRVIVFSEALNAASKTAIQAAFAAAITEDDGVDNVDATTFAYVWSANDTTLTVTATVGGDDAAAAIGAIANTAVTDLAGNTSAALDLQL